MPNWNVTFYDDDTGYAYRVQVKRLTVGDAVQADMLGDEITRRDTLRGRELLTLSQIYPFMKFATAESERAVVEEAIEEVNDTGDPVVPDDAEWEPFELTEAAFLILPEFLALRWQHEAILKNPHRDPTYEALKKKLLREKLQPESAPTTSSETDSEITNDSASLND